MILTEIAYNLYLLQLHVLGFDSEEAEEEIDHGAMPHSVKTMPTNYYDHAWQREAAENFTLILLPQTGF